MDYSSVRQSSSHGSAVSVNHRALITRALTKYPVDHALFRELLQNSADARSNSATIQFSTPSTDMNPLEIHNIPINRLTFMNDGMDFNDDDWKRLKEIASGNPNESKIGAFGVGFYSVFELTDEPLVHSGNRIVNFKYKGVQLHYYDNDAPEYQKGTLIDLPYKHIGKLGDIGDFIGFLIQNFLLVNLNEINFEILYGNGTKKSVLRLTKTQGSTLPMNTPSAFKCARSLFFSLKEVKMTQFTVGCQYMNAAFLPPLSMNRGIFALGKQLFSSLTETPKDPEGITEFSCELSRVDASISVSVDRKFKEKITESLLKPPPRATTISMLSISDASGVSSLNSKLRHYVFPEDVNDAKIFIGFSTKQSTGFRSHLALQSAIPTMERTALDLAHPYVKEWNLELLRMAGAVARFAYENELVRCKFLDLADQSKCIEQAKMVCYGFKFKSSAPDKTIGEYVKNGFYKSAYQTLVPSTQGVLPSTEVKYTDEKMMKLLKKTPVIDDIELADYLRTFVTIEKVTPSEIAADVCSSPLELGRAKSYIDWLKNHWHEFSSDDKRKLTNFTIDVNSDLIDLGSATSYHDLSILNIAAISKNLPENCIPASVVQEIGPHNLQKVFGLRPLQAFPCIEMRVGVLIRLSHSSKSPAANSDRLANEILEISSLCWPQLDSETQAQLVELLSTVQCIPTTNMGLQYPKDTYIEPIKGFNNVPVATKKFSPDWLESIGVRKSLNMRVVLEKLMNDELSWTNEDLISYLQTNQKNLKRSDWHVLRESFFFRSNGFQGLFKASDLYAPDPTLAKLKIPTLKHEGWSAYSSEAKLMSALGLKQFPSASSLLSQGVATKQPNVAIDYFLNHFREAKYNTQEIRNLQFLPTTTPQILASPANCYTDNEVSIFGELVLAPQYETAANTLGVVRSPHVSKLLFQVIREPEKYLSSANTREDVFAYFAKKVHELNRGDVELCKRRRIIPAVDPYTNKTVWYRPDEVFLPYRGDDPELDVLRPILPTYRATSRSLAFFHFLNVSEFPSAHQLATHIVQNPVAAFEKLNNRDVYEQALCLIGKKWDGSISHDNDLVTKMLQSPFLLGEKFSPKDGEKTTSLYRRADLAIVNDSIIFNQFKSVIVTAPQDANVELLYRKLNVPTLSSLLKERFYVDSEINDPESLNALKERIQERLKLFMEYTKSPLLTRNTNLKIKLVRGIQIERQLPPHRAISISTTCHWNAKADELLLVPRNIDWLDVANALCKKFIERPNQDTVVVLELQLSASLSDLERKGYNIERLRRKKAGKISLESLMNKSKERSTTPQRPEESPQEVSNQQPPRQPPSSSQKLPPKPQQTPQEQLYHQRNQQKAQQEESDRSIVQSQSQSQNANTQADPALPGPSKFIPSWINKMLSGSDGAGANNGDDRSGAVSLPPDSGNRGINNDSAVGAQSVGRSPKNNVGQPNQDVSQEQKMQSFDNTLGSGRSKVRQFNGNTLSGNDNVDIPADLAPQPTESCGVGNRHEISLKSTLENGVKVFQDDANTQPRQDELVLSEMLLWLSRVYSISPECISIFREKSSTVAFNQNGSLFFNSYHLPDTPNALDYWYTIMAHELAHNLCGPHNSTHSFFTEGYIRSTLRQYLSANGH